MENILAISNHLSRALLILLAYITLMVIFKASKFLLPKVIQQSRIRNRIPEIIGLVLSIVFITFSIILFEPEIKEFAIPFSVFGAGIAVALQNVIVSLAGRIVIIGTGIYRVGDRVQIGEVKGDVVGVGFLRTSLMEIGNWVKADQFSGRIIHIPNSTVFKDNIMNYSAAFSYVWDEVSIPIKYGSSQKNTRLMLLSIANNITHDYKADAKIEWERMMKKYMLNMVNFEPIITMVANDNWMEFNVRYIVPYNLRRATKDQLYSSIIDSIVQEGSTIELGSTTLEITSFPDLGANQKN